MTITCSWSLTPCDRLPTQPIMPKSDERDVGGARREQTRHRDISILPILTTICSENVSLLVKRTNPDCTQTTCWLMAAATARTRSENTNQDYSVHVFDPDYIHTNGGREGGG